MKKMMKQYFYVWKKDYNFKTFTTSALSLIVGIAFAVYNGFLGLIYSSVWNASICVYYVLLAIVRGRIICAERKSDKRYGKKWKNYRKKVYFSTHIIIFLMNVSLIIPITVMIKGGRVYNHGMIPAITMATYTTYRIIMAILHYSKSRKIDNILIKELRTVSLIDTFVAILNLQNTMIIANAGEITESMRILSIISSTIIWLAILILSVFSYKRFSEL